MSEIETWINKHEKLLTIVILIFGIFFTIFSVQYAFNLEQDTIKHNTAVLVYDDIEKLEWTLNKLNQQIINNNNTTFKIISPVYPENGVYYISRQEISSLDYGLARNITTFYMDMYYAEIYRKVMITAIEENNLEAYKISFEQYKFAIEDAIYFQPIVLKELKEKYDIPENSLKNRFNL